MLEELELLNKEAIYSVLNELTQYLDSLEILSSVDSTNNYLLKKNVLDQSFAAVFAEQQTAGRGQYDRSWDSLDYAKQIALSLLYPGSNLQIEGLSLTAAIAVVQALNEYGLHEIKLKWPNDIMFQEKKLGGILVEINTVGQANKVVIGIGLNLYPPTNLIKTHSVTDIFSILSTLPKRNYLAGLVLKHALLTLKTFKSKGFTNFISTWNKLDLFQNKLINLHFENKVFEGVGKGINQQGEYCVLIKDQLTCFNKGSIRLKK